MQRLRGFTLIELLVALAAMALLALVSWRGLDGIAQVQSDSRTRGDALLTLQTTLSQWGADLDATTTLAGLRALDWDGRVLRLTRRSADGSLPAVHVVGWTLRAGAEGAQWHRWQSPPLTTQAEWRQAWALAARWAQEGERDAQGTEVALLPVARWDLLYFRGGTWSAAVPADTLGPATPLPDGVRLVLTLPPGGALAGMVTRDWVRPTAGGARS